jgi:hypothetical protein
MSSRSLPKILHEDLRFHPYKVNITKGLKEQDKASCVNIWRQFLDLVDNDEGVLEGPIVSDEAHFRLYSYINEQNFRYCSDKKPLHSKEVTVWCGWALLL